MAVQDSWTHFFLKFRWILIIFLALPAGFLFDLAFQVREWYIHKTGNHQHEEKVGDIQRQVKEYRKKNIKRPLCTARKDYLSMRFRETDYKKADNTVKVDLYDVISIDTKRKVVSVEPLVSIGQLTHFLAQRGWTLPVVPELDDLTIGGLINGYGIETSSHKHGLFSDIVTSCDVVLADGSVVTCTADNEHKDLFFGLPWSYGALGILVKAEIKIIPKADYVRVRYYPFHNFKQFSQEFGKLSLQGDKAPDFVEGIAFSPDDVVLMVGDLTNEVDTKKVNKIGKYYSPIFYYHVKEFLTKQPLKKGEVFEEYIPLRDYYHRHTKGLFWMIDSMLPFGNHWLFRYTLAWMMPLKVIFLKMTQPKIIQQYYETTHMFQDILVPLSKLEEVMDYCHKKFEVYPIWLCPHKCVTTEPQGMLSGSEEMYIDVGLYGPMQTAFRSAKFDHVEALRGLEGYMRDINGFQALYATTEMTRTEWAQMFDQKLYNANRKKYGAEGVFMDAYEKVKRPGK